MAFVDITTPKSPAGVAALLLQCKSGKRDFTPELCLDVLRATNFAKNIRDMLTMITELPPSEQQAFKEVVLSTFDRRKQSNDVLILGKKLAVSGGYEAEFNSVDKAGVAEGEYLLSGLGKLGLVVDAFDERADYSSYEEVFIASDRVNLMYCDLASVKKLRFKEGAAVYLSGATNLPKELNFSMCKDVDLSHCDLATVKNVRFKEGAGVELLGAKNLPEELDFSMCGWVCLYDCDLAELKELTFKDGAVVRLLGIENWPENLDVSMCEEVMLSRCNLAQVKSLQFKKDAKVFLFEVKNLPENLDVSMCEEVTLRECDLSQVKYLRFKDLAQRENSKARIPNKVKVTYDEVEPIGANILEKGGR